MAYTRSFCRTQATDACRCGEIESMPLSRRLSRGRERIRTCRRTLIRDLQIFRVVKRRVGSAIRRIDSRAAHLRRCEREQIPVSPMLVNDRYTKQSAKRTHFYTLQSEGQFNCGGRPTRASAIFSASNRSPGTVNVCARTALPMTFTFILTRRSMGSWTTVGCLNAFATAA